MKKEKIKLEELKVKSFITEINQSGVNKLRAGGPGDTEDGDQCNDGGGDTNTDTGVILGEVVSEYLVCSASYCTRFLC